MIICPRKYQWNWFFEEDLLTCVGLDCDQVTGSFLAEITKQDILISESKQYADEKKVWHEVMFYYLIGGRLATTVHINVKDGITLW